MGTGPETFALGLLIRYFPIAVIVLTVTLHGLPIAIRPTFVNLRVPERKAFFSVVLPVLLPNAALTVVLLSLLMPLDVIGSTIGGGGQIQTFGNLIFGYSHTRDVQGVASLLTVFFVAFATLLLALVIAASSRRGGAMLQNSPPSVEPFTSRRLVYLNPVFIAYIAAYVGIVAALLLQRRSSANQYDELVQALQTSLLIIAPVTIMAGVIALFIGSWIHLSRSEASTVRGRIIAASLIVPALLPPVLAGRMAAIVQGMLGRQSGDAAIAAWYMYFLGCIPVLVVLSHPLVFDRTMPKLARNHRIAIDDYVYSIMAPMIASAVVVGCGLFAAISMADAMIVRYIGGSTKTLGLVLANHQEGTLAPGDYVFLGGLGLVALTLLLLLGAVMVGMQTRFVARYVRSSPHPPAAS